MKHLTLFLLCAALFGCAGVQKEAKYPTGMDRDGVKQDDIYGEKESIFGEDGFRIFGDRKSDSAGSTDVITVNSYLWRASLDTVSFMPLTNVDPFGGVILTDWYSDPDKQDERYKLNVFVIGSQLRSDAIRVSAFQQKKKRGKWVDVNVDSSIATKIEDAILTRARQIRIAQNDG
jgi:hypothetical protein